MQSIFIPLVLIVVIQQNKKGKHIPHTRITCTYKLLSNKTVPGRRVFWSKIQSIFIPLVLIVVIQENEKRSNTFSSHTRITFVHTNCYQTKHQIECNQRQKYYSRTLIANNANIQHNTIQTNKQTKWHLHDVATSSNSLSFETVKFVLLASAILLHETVGDGMLIGDVLSVYWEVVC